MKCTWPRGSASLQIGGPYGAHTGKEQGRGRGRRSRVRVPPGSSGDESACATRSCRDWRACYRRPLKKGDVPTLMKFFDDGRAMEVVEGRSIRPRAPVVTGILVTSTAIPLPPKAGAESQEPSRISDLRRLSLSFFLWSRFLTTRFFLAEAELPRGGARGQVKRMLAILARPRRWSTILRRSA